jgi:pantetheine-phosphate adenylyltransferase
MVRALYPGSFDPVTRGHLDLIERARGLFESVTVAVAVNSQKRTLFTPAERVEMMRGEVPDGIEVVSFGGLVVDFCDREGYGVILRGLRTIVDFEYEYQMALTNRHLCPTVETVFVMPSAEHSFVSSTLIKDVVRHGGDVASFVTEDVERRLAERLRA